MAPAYLQATDVLLRPQNLGRRSSGRASGASSSARPSPTSQAINERLDKVRALAIFSADVISSTAYATEEILLVLILAGMGALNASLPIAGVIALLLIVVAFSYRQTVRAYPSGGGSYTVAQREPGDVSRAHRRVGADDRLRPDRRRHRRPPASPPSPPPRPASTTSASNWR